MKMFLIGLAMLVAMVSKSDMQTIMLPDGTMITCSTFGNITNCW